MSASRGWRPAAARSPVQAGGDGARTGRPAVVDDERQQQQQDDRGRTDAGLVLRAHRPALVVAPGGVEHRLDRPGAAARHRGQPVGALVVAGLGDADRVDLVQRGEVGAQRRLHRAQRRAAARAGRAARRAASSMSPLPVRISPLASAGEPPVWALARNGAVCSWLSSTLTVRSVSSEWRLACVRCSRSEIAPMAITPNDEGEPRDCLRADQGEVSQEGSALPTVYRPPAPGALRCEHPRPCPPPRAPISSPTSFRAPPRSSPRGRRASARTSPHAAGAPAPDRLAAAWDAFGERMADHYPFFHPRYAGQMLKPPHPVAVAGYLAAMLVNPNNHALDGGPGASGLEVEVVDQLRVMFGLPSPGLGHLTSSGTIANLEALWIAREVHPGKRIVHCSAAHYTHARMCELLGVTGTAVATRRRGAHRPRRRGGRVRARRRRDRRADHRLDRPGSHRSRRRGARAARALRRAPARRRRLRRLLHAAGPRRRPARRARAVRGDRAVRLRRRRSAQARPAALRLRRGALRRPRGRARLSPRLAVHVLHRGRPAPRARSAWSARAPAPRPPGCG